MRLETLFEKFELFADAPDAVAKMRELILDLAVQGRLSATTDSDDWVPIRVGDIVAEGLSSVNPAETPERLFELWSVPAYASGQPEVLYGGEIGSSKRALENGSILLGKINPHLNRVWKVARRTNHPLIASPEWITIRPDKTWDSDFLARLLTSPSFNRDLCSTAQGMGSLTRANTRKVAELEIRRPSLAEQKRIVAKVDALMAMCDRLETEQQERETRHAALARASLARFAEAPTPANLDWIFHSSFSIPPADLRKSILTLAVQGKLVPQDPNDETGEQILRRIQAGLSLKRGANGSMPTNDHGELPFDLPDGWSASRLGSILLPTRGISYGVIKLGPEPQQGGVFILRCSNVRFRRIDLNGIRKVTEELSSEYGRTVLEGGEVLINVRGTLGGCAVVPPELKGYNIAREVAVIPVHTEIDPTFLLNVIASPYFQDRVDENLRGIAYEGLNLGLLRDFLVPIPPLTEQRRIVAKVDELMAWVDALETQLATARSAGTNLLAAAVAEITNGNKAHAASEI
ncbi:restriction endonuclease subunit S [Paucibacter sp. O1-1]|nr:restriction endonuclease subunit S [Paucibacter sp. O1-1]MDA3829883.1 restriction endonuclease subunit S [Paucibacter sp. O1-1]